MRMAGEADIAPTGDVVKALSSGVHGPTPAPTGAVNLNAMKALIGSCLNAIKSQHCSCF